MICGDGDKTGLVDMKKHINDVEMDFRVQKVKSEEQNAASEVVL